MARAAIGICLAAAIAAAVFVAGPATAGFVQPEIACAYDPATKVVTVNYGDPTAADTSNQLPSLELIRHGKELLFREVTGGEIDTRPCTGGTPTVDNTDRIDLRLVVDQALGTLTFIDLTGGPLGPGATPETGGSEIEIDADLDAKPEFDISGMRKKGDYWVFGTSGDRHQVNFNPRERKPDADLVIHDPEPDFFIDESKGDEKLIATGGKGTGGALAVHVGLFGGAGDNVLAGGSADDYIEGGDGKDLILGGNGNDRLDIYGGDGKDRINCGRGEDRAGATKADKVKACEHVGPPHA